MIDEIIVSQRITISLADVLSVFEAVSQGDRRWAGAVTVQQERSLRAAVALGLVRRRLGEEHEQPELLLQYAMAVPPDGFDRAAREVLDYLKVQDVMGL